jgi:acetyl-CoA carboxylase biotin carboxyl carrier protein
LDIKYLKSIIKMVAETDITEFELETDGEKIRFLRETNAEKVKYIIPQPEMAERIVHTPATLQASEIEDSIQVSEQIPDKNQTICSPIVGTMYRAPSPDSPPYVEVGQVVEKGQVLCIVEAMKLMNEIEAEFRCKIVRIFKENAQPVEYAEPLFLVEPF